MRTVIFSKSCSRCGASTIFEGRTFPKSVRRASPTGTGKKNQQESVLTPSLDALFRPWVRFCSILGPQLGPLGPTFGRLSRLFGPLFGHLWFSFARGCSGRVPGSILGHPGDPPGKNFETFFGDSRRPFSHAWRPESVPSLSKFGPKFGSVCRSSLAFPPQLAQTFS